MAPKLLKLEQDLLLLSHQMFCFAQLVRSYFKELGVYVKFKTQSIISNLTLCFLYLK